MTHVSGISVKTLTPDMGSRSEPSKSHPWGYTIADMDDIRNGLFLWFRTQSAVLLHARQNPAAKAVLCKF